MTDDLTFDVAIVGASFAGLIAARTLAMRGLSVVVLEAKREPGARVHTTGILVKEAADLLDLPSDLTRKVRGVRLYAPNRRSVDLFAPGYYFLTTRTADVLRLMAKDARAAGARILCGARVQGMERAAGLTRIAPHGLSARFIIGADGAKSATAAALNLGRNTKFLVGVEAEMEPLPGLDERFLHCFVDSRLAPGYLGWVAPGPGVTQVGLATRRADKPSLQAFQDATAPYFAYGASHVVERRSGVIPSGGIVRPFHRPGALLIGDAAGMVSPLTGGGIYLALRLGRLAGLAVAEHLLDAGPEPGLAMARHLPNFAVKQALRRVADLAPANMLMNLALLSAPGRALAQRLYFHRRGPGTRFDPSLIDRLSEERLESRV